MDRSASVAITFLSVVLSNLRFFTTDLDIALFRSGSPSRILSNLPNDAVLTCVANNAAAVLALPRCNRCAVEFVSITSLFPFLPDDFKSTGKPTGKSNFPPSRPDFRPAVIDFKTRVDVPFDKFPARSSLRICCSTFLSTRLRFASLCFSQGSNMGSSPAFTSIMGHSLSSFPAFLKPCRYCQSPMESSHTFAERLSLF